MTTNTTIIETIRPLVHELDTAIEQLEREKKTARDLEERQEETQAAIADAEQQVAELRDRARTRKREEDARRVEALVSGGAKPGDLPVAEEPTDDLGDVAARLKALRHDAEIIERAGTAQREKVAAAEEAVREAKASILPAAVAAAAAAFEESIRGIVPELRAFYMLSVLDREASVLDIQDHARRRHPTRSIKALSARGLTCTRPAGPGNSLLRVHTGDLVPLPEQVGTYTGDTPTAQQWLDDLVAAARAEPRTESKTTKRSARVA